MPGGGTRNDYTHLAESSSGKNRFFHPDLHIQDLHIHDLRIHRLRTHPSTGPTWRRWRSWRWRRFPWRRLVRRRGLPWRRVFLRRRSRRQPGQLRRQQREHARRFVLVLVPQFRLIQTLDLRRRRLSQPLRISQWKCLVSPPIHHCRRSIPFLRQRPHRRRLSALGCSLRGKRYSRSR